MKDTCKAHNKHDASWWHHDARGIPLCRICPDCMDEKLSVYRSDVLTDGNYDTDEYIEPEGY
jgi:hypothetical protein